MNGIHGQLETLVRSARRRAQGSRVIGVRENSNEAVPAEVVVDEERWMVRRVRSPLEARMALVDAGPDGRLLLLTSLPDLDAEIKARMARRRLLDVQPWQLVREQFQAKRLDPRVVKQGPWMVRELLAGAPAGGYSPAPSGLLDLDTAWAALMPRLGLFAARPSLGDVLAASASGSLTARWVALEEDFRKAVSKRLSEVLGSIGGLITAVLDGGSGDLLVPLGLVLDLLLAEELAQDPRALVLRTRLERYGLHLEEPLLAQPWAREARRWVTDSLASNGEHAQQGWSVLEVAERQIRELRGEDLLECSDMLAASFRRRLLRLGQHLSGAATGAFDRPAAEAAFGRVQNHALPVFDTALAQQRDRARDALRLARWMASEEAQPHSLATHSDRYRAEGAFVDRARFSIARGEGDRELAAIYSALVEQAEERREQQNRAFAERLTRVLADSEGAGEVLPIEDALPRIVAPLAQQVQVLLVVMDGMSEAIAEELVEDILQLSGFERMCPAESLRLPPMVGLLPSTTEVCRTSLLSGSPRVGNQDEERDGFEALAARCGWRGKTTKQRILFHKAELTSNNRSLAPAVLEALESSARVVAVVVNAVDDQLSGGEQLRLDWKLERVPVLQELVHQAELLGRAVVLTSDHGHVVETGSSRKAASDGNDGRWRPVGSKLEEGEIEVRGPRVLRPAAGGPCVLPWSERLRYSNPHAGYHGGASPQEVVTPLVVLVPGTRSADLPGWSAEVQVHPWWWEGRDPEEKSMPQVQLPPPAPQSARRPARRPEPTPSLFEKPAATASAADDHPQWLEPLFSSSLWADQRRLAGRTPPANEEVAEVLGALAGAGGKLSLDALRNRTRFTVPRLRGLLTAMGRILNVEGYAVLEVDHGAAEVQLAIGLLLTQFGLDGEERT